MAQAITARPVEELLKWPAEGLTRVPMQVFSDPEIYMWEQDLIFRGPTWNFLGFEIEAPRPNDFFTSAIGDTPIIVVHTADGTLNAFVNRCVHKGATICYQSSGSCERFTCPYHNWIYDHSGKLLSVAFEKGLPGQDGKRQGGMPPDFDKSQHRLRRLRVETIGGLIFGTFSEEAPPLETYLGPVMAGHIRRTLHGRPKILTKYRQVMHNNWKLYAENTRDNYHPSLLHSFFVTFKLNRLSAEGGVHQDDRNWHHIVFAKKHTDKGAEEYNSGTILAQKDNFGLKDPSLINSWLEFDDEITNSIQAVFPSFALQQILNSIGTRQLLPLGPEKCELVWTLVGFEEDSAEEAYMRLKQSNLVGPAGLVSMEDGIIGDFVQRGIKGDLDVAAIVMMGGHGVGSASTRATETSVRGFWKAYKELMHV
jgi:anthranilate 1,2-dioxygenase large subunit/terephthalate 1,2-dioxygenase oxygenase component alpha subunit